MAAVKAGGSGARPASPMSITARPRRVLMLAACPMPAPQGTQVYVGQLADALARRGHAVELVTYGIGVGDLRAHDGAARFAVCRARAAPGHRKTAPGPSWGRPAADGLLVLAALGAARRARASGAPFDLIHAHNYEGALVGALVGRLSGLPMLYHAHNLMGDELGTYFDEPGMKALGAAFGRWLDARVPPLADAAVAISRAAQRRLEIARGGPVAWLPPAVDFGPPVASLPCKPLIYIGNVDGYQGVEVMLGALSRLRGRGDAGCTIVTADERAAGQVAAFGLGERVEVVEHGDFEAVKGRLAGARVALLPRVVASGYPIKLLNYLAAGRPVVACEGGAQGLGLAEGVVSTPDGDEGAFAAAIERLLDDRAMAVVLGERAREASARFAWPASVEALEAVYEEMLGGKGLPSRARG